MAKAKQPVKKDQKVANKEAAKQAQKKKPQKEASSESESSDEDSDSSEEEVKVPVQQQKAAAGKGKAKAKESSSDSDDSSDESSEEETAAPAAKGKAAAKDSDEESSDESSSDEEEAMEEEKPKASNGPQKRGREDTDVGDAKRVKDDSGFAVAVFFNGDGVTENDLHKVFPGMTGFEQAKSAFIVNFASFQEARNAQSTQDYKGMNVRATMFMKPREERSFSNGGAAGAVTNTGTVFVGNLPFDGLSEDAVAQHFGSVGTVTGVRLATDRETGRFRGFGHVTFSAPEEAQRAVDELNGAEFNGREIKVDHESNKQSGGGDRGGRGRGRGGPFSPRGGSFSPRGRGGDFGGFGGRGGDRGRGRGGRGAPRGGRDMSFKGTKTTFD